MSSVSEIPVSPSPAPALVVFVLGVPTLVVLALAVVFNWGR